MNVYTASGRLTRDPVLKQSQNGSSFATSSIAINERMNGNDVTTYIDIIVFGKLSEVMTSHVKKGDLIFISGRLNQDFYQDKNGENRSSYKVIINTFDMINTSGSNRNSQQQPQQQQYQNQNNVNRNNSNIQNQNQNYNQNTQNKVNQNNYNNGGNNQNYSYPPPLPQDNSFDNQNPFE